MRIQDQDQPHKKDCFYKKPQQEETRNKTCEWNNDKVEEEESVSIVQKLT